MSICLVQTALSTLSHIHTSNMASFQWQVKWPATRCRRMSKTASRWLAICRPRGCTVASGIVGVCNRSQKRTSKCTCL